MLAVYASPPPSPAVDARLTIGLRAADFPDRTFTGKSTSALHGAPRFVPLSIPTSDRNTIVSAVTAYADTGRGDVRALKDQPGFRLRVGAWRVLFDITADLVSIRHVVRRSERRRY